MFHKGTGDDIEKLVRRHNKKSHDWFGQNVLNYPIQGGSALVLKEAAANLFQWIVKNGYFGTVLFCVFVHDEICIEFPKELTDLMSSKIKEIMARMDIPATTKSFLNKI